MAYTYNTNNAGSFHTFSISGEFNAYPNRMPAIEWENIETPETFINGRGMDGLQGHMGSEPTSLTAESSFESVPSVTSHGTQIHGYDQSPYPGHYWPVAGQDSQLYRSSFVSRDNSFASTVTLEDPTTTPTPTSFPLGYWGGDESGPFTNTFHVNVQTPYQPGTGPTGTGMMQTWRFRSYETPHARSNEHTDAEAGPSGLAAPFIQYVAPSLTNPSGGSSEATADAETNHTVTEEEAAPATRCPRGILPPRNWRLRYQEDVRTLCAWAKEWDGLPKVPTHEIALGIALEAIHTVRPPVHNTHKLRRGTGTRSAQGDKASDAEQRRREGIREVNEVLSRYYHLPVNQLVWACPELLSKVLNEVEGLEKDTS